MEDFDDINMHGTTVKKILDYVFSDISESSKFCIDKARGKLTGIQSRLWWRKTVPL
jgi:hypothetical protein